MECVSSRAFSIERSSSTNGFYLRGSIPTGRSFWARSASNVAGGKHRSQSLICLRSSLFASSDLRLSSLVRASELSGRKRLSINAAAIGDALSFCARQRENPISFTVELLDPSFIGSFSSYLGADNVVTEPATSIDFATSLTVPGSSTELSFLGAGVREKQIAFLKVKVYAVGVYAEAQVRASLNSWKGKSAAELATDDAVYKELADAPIEKALQIVLARDVDGATFWGALDEALVPRLKAGGAGADGDKALAALGDVFRSRSLKKGFVITLTWVQPTSLKIALSEGPSAPLNNEASIESKALLSALFDVFLGPNAVSPSAKLAVADGIAKLI